MEGRAGAWCGHVDRIGWLNILWLLAEWTIARRRGVSIFKRDTGAHMQPFRQSVTGIDCVTSNDIEYLWQVYKRASGADMIMMREYAHGVLRKEAVLRIGQRDLRREEVKTDKALRSEEKRAAAKVINSSFLAPLESLHLWEAEYVDSHSIKLIFRQISMSRSWVKPLGQERQSTRAITAMTSCAICSWASSFPLQRPARRLLKANLPLLSRMKNSTSRC